MSVTYVHFRPANLHIPRRRKINWLALLVWGVMPLASIAGWYGLIRWIVGHL